MDKDAIKESIKFHLKSFIPKKVIFDKKKDDWLKKKADRLNRGDKKYKASDLKAHLGGTYKNVADYLSYIDIKSEGYYFYSIDEFSYIRDNNFPVDNLSPNYTVFFEPLEKVEKDFKNLKDSAYFFSALYKYIDRAKEYLENKSDFKDKKSRTYIQHNYLDRIKNSSVESFDEALQRILFFNGLFWQTEHRLVGFGPLDRILDNLYKNDLKSKAETDKTIKEKITEFLKCGHEHFVYKSNNLVGDTGQIIQLSGYYQKNKTFISKLDYIFIEAVKELQLPDPKILLRITKDTPRDLYELSLESIKTGIGCPLFANDDAIIPALVSSGYKESDAYNFSTSACWEPMIWGESADQNNQTNIIPVLPLNKLLSSGNTFELFDEFLKAYKAELQNHLKSVELELKYKRYSVDPFLTIMTKDCKRRQLDITKGGAKYFNYGILTVSFKNFIDSLFIIKKNVFDEKKYTLEELNKKRLKEDFTDLLESKSFGEDDKEVISIINDLTALIIDYFKGKKNHYGGEYNIGFSSPSYVEAATGAEPSLDGRKKGEPYSIHISSDKPLAYTELMNFAGKLDYSNHRYNGNVVDFMVSESFLDNNFDKFVDFLILSRKTGFFEMQMNVTNSKVLIDAKKNPEKFKNLIVRIWGFSTYFNDLPEEYKDMLINRALRTEGKK